MTTNPQPLTNDAIPPWFMEFAQENARQHAELAAQIAGVRIETAEKIAELIAQVAADKAELARQMAADKAELTAQIDAKTGALRTEMHRDSVTLMRWVVGTTAGMGIAIAGSLVYAVERLA